MSATYSLGTRKVDDVEVVTLRQAEDIFAEVAPSLGHNCFAFRSGGPVLEEVPWATFAAKPTGFGFPILFPFPNRIRDGSFVFEGKTYHVDPPRHGMVRDKPWTIVDTGASESDGAFVAASLASADFPETILAQFPFPFVIEVTYRLRDGVLSMETVVRNSGPGNLPFGLGIHPYFHRGANATILAPANQRWELVDALPTGRKLELEGAYDLRQTRPLAGLELDDIYTDLIADASGRVECVLGDADSGRKIVVAWDAHPFPELVLFTPPAGRMAFCIEPYTCPTDAFNLEAKGLDGNVEVLAPGESKAYTIEVRAEGGS
jgi:aldose 1-epimerase